MQGRCAAMNTIPRLAAIWLTSRVSLNFAREDIKLTITPSNKDTLVFKIDSTAASRACSFAAPFTRVETRRGIQRSLAGRDMKDEYRRIGWSVSVCAGRVPQKRHVCVAGTQLELGAIICRGVLPCLLHDLRDNAKSRTPVTKSSAPGTSTR